ncbi:MAG: 2-C-methyl-D-erythritol 2,4-cyclodiphosphate synthase [Bacteroidales bacterium]|nr:2-C-methyl-D-erythritol 2,4-cyclodiphosphate synthase [Bacteroidales bacterium]
MMPRIGFGYDVHGFADDRELWLGGIKIDHEKGLLGHSDADVLIHAICDALLGAAALGDIGKHFPDTSSDFKNIDSKILLTHTIKLISQKGYVPGNVDVTIALQRPKIAPHIEAMRKTLAGIMKMDVDAVSIKATTTEKLGFEGREEGVSAYAIVMIFPV